MMIRDGRQAAISAAEEKGDVDILVFGLTGAVLLFYLTFILPTQWLKVVRVRHDCGLGIRVLQISDLHAERIRVGCARLKRLIAEARPDYVALTGDFTEEARRLPKVRQYAEAACAAGVPVFAVLGNHDYRLPPQALDQLIHTLEDAGVKVLRNEWAEAGGIQWVGIDDFESGKSDIEKAFRGTDPEKPCVVLTHTPELVLHLKRQYKYLMAGHLHGKQFNIPFFFLFYNMGRLARSGVYRGLHHGTNGPFYISAGIGQSEINLRFLVRSEVTIHDL